MDRVGDWRSRLLVHQEHNLVHMAAHCISQLPPGKLPGQWVQASYAPLFVRAQDSVADRIERGRELLLALAQGLCGAAQVSDVPAHGVDQVLLRCECGLPSQSSPRSVLGHVAQLKIGALRLPSREPPHPLLKDSNVIRVERVLDPNRHQFFLRVAKGLPKRRVHAQPVSKGVTDCHGIRGYGEETFQFCRAFAKEFLQFVTGDRCFLECVQHSVEGVGHGAKLVGSGMVDPYLAIPSRDCASGCYKSSDRAEDQPDQKSRPGQRRDRQHGGSNQQQTPRRASRGNEGVGLRERLGREIHFIPCDAGAQSRMDCEC